MTKLRIHHEQKLKDKDNKATENRRGKHARQNEPALLDRPNEELPACIEEIPARIDEVACTLKKIEAHVDQQANLSVVAIAVIETKAREKRGWRGWIQPLLWAIFMWLLSCCSQQAREWFNNAVGQLIDDNWTVIDKWIVIRSIADMVRSMADLVQWLGARAH